MVHVSYLFTTYERIVMQPLVNPTFTIMWVIVAVVSQDVCIM